MAKYRKQHKHNTKIKRKQKNETQISKSSKEKKLKSHTCNILWLILVINVHEIKTVNKTKQNL